MAKDRELIKGFYVNESKQSWIKYELNFDVSELAKMLTTYKDVFEANKGKGRIVIAESQQGKLYATLSTWKPQAKPNVDEHLSDRDDDLPF